MKIVIEIPKSYEKLIQELFNKFEKVNSTRSELTMDKLGARGKLMNAAVYYGGWDIKLVE